MNSQEKEYKPEGAKTFGAMVYVGVAVACTTLFISFVLTAFPQNAYLSRIVMTLAGMLVGASMLAFPVAMHNWTVEKNHRKWTTILYYLEMVFVVVNTVVAFLKLLSINTGYAMPEWAVLYEPFSVAAIVYTLFAWGTVFLLDPEHKRTQKAREADQRFEDALSEKMLEFVESEQGEDVVIQIATQRANERYSVDKYTTHKKHFGTKKNGSIPAPAVFTEKQAVSPSPLGEDDGES